MAKVTLSVNESRQWYYGRPEEKIAIADAVNNLAGALGGHGIDLVDADGVDASDHADKYGHLTFQYAATLDK